MPNYRITSTAMNTVLSIEQVEKSFVLHTQNGTVLKVLDDVDLSVASGEVVGLCGPSGTGKSSLIKAVYGTYRVGTGRINVFTSQGIIDIAGAPARKIVELRAHTIGYVSQFLRVIPRVATVDIVAAAAMEAGVEEGDARKRAEELLERLRIPKPLHALSPLTFSGGEQQRVNIARAMSAPRPLMLFDEPTASLDPENRDTVLKMIRDLADQGTAILGIFHNPADREQLDAREFEMQAIRDLENA
ncbi:MAG: phosphonate C-P lyase system protein PhnL [Pseudomonadota bacterium]